MLEKHLILNLIKCKKNCNVKECNRKYYAKGYCHRHYRQIKKYGRIVGDPVRSRYDPNKIICGDGICYIILTSQLGVPIACAIIDKEDKKRVEKLKWCISGNGYAHSPIIGYLHNFILSRRSNYKYNVDHKNRTPLDCRKSNLRIGTQSLNSSNSPLQKNNTSGYKGVFWNKQLNKWMAKICVMGKQIYLGYFEDKKDAAESYNDGAKKYFGEFAWLNQL